MKTGPLPPAGPDRVQAGKRHPAPVDPTESFHSPVKSPAPEKKEGGGSVFSLSLRTFSPEKILESVGLPADTLSRRIVQFLTLLQLPFKKEIIQSLRASSLPYPINQREGAAWLHTLALAKGVHLSINFVSRTLSELFPTLPSTKEEQGGYFPVKTSSSPNPSQAVESLDPDGGHPDDGASTFSQNENQSFNEKNPPQSEEKSEEEAPARFLLQKIQELCDPLVGGPSFSSQEPGGLLSSLFVSSLPSWNFFNRIPSKTGREWLILPLTPEEGVSGTLRFLFSTAPNNPPLLQSFTIDVTDIPRFRFVFVFSQGSSNQWRALVMSRPYPSDTKGIQAILAPFTQEVTYKPIPQEEGLFPELEDLLEL
ncbi:hypothetical protein [Treponema sp. J25]|uniref:hypothetical protein n=1 Tax=Treponema sp. J25 TaxID=2094121 RepID=UPI00104EA19D|nr:hypothetical protein [Treponema sp. J25]TCW61143.1 hypothetical protein C5O22_07785 [Treponema sp. J25]